MKLVFCARMKSYKESVMNPLERIESYSSEFTKSDRDIADVVLKDPREAVRSSIDHLAKVANVSKSAIVRFSNRIGYSGFTDFKYDLSRYLVSQNASASDDTEKKDPIHAITGLYSRYISMIADCISEEDLKKAAEIILRSDRIKIYGQNRTYHSALQLRTRFAKISLDAEAVCDLSLMTDLSYTLKEKDCLIIFTIADNTGLYKRQLPIYKESRCSVICIAMTPSLPFRKQCSEYIVLPRISKDSAVSFLDDQAIYFVFIELLMDAIASRMQDHR